MDVLAPHFFASLGAKVAALNSAGKDIIRLDEGAPDLPPARPIIEALAGRLKDRIATLTSRIAVRMPSGRPGLLCMDVSMV
jgi:hypothetical protein